MKALFLEPSNDTFIQFFRYIFVGGAAFIADAGALWICSLFSHYLIAAAIAFVVGITVNFILSKRLVFSESSRNSAVEFAAYVIIGIIGLGFTELFMYIFTDKLGIYFMLSKIITAIIVLIWNFAARKIILYKER